MKTRVSGIKPTGKIHLGNYFGAIKQYIEKQDMGSNIYFVADYHALTTIPDRDRLKRDSINIVLDYLAFGLDPEKSTIFLQSHVPQHAELCWILSNSTPFSLLQRAHAFKSRLDKSENINTGLFTYPVLMAADILIYDADLVPVGKDQKQHVEITRDIAIKFNNNYREVFTLPEAEIVEDSKLVLGTDGRKMSKSYNNTVEIFSSEKELKKQIFSIVTDSKGVDEPKDPEQCNIFSIFKLFLDTNELHKLKDEYKQGIGYGELKKHLFERVVDYIKPFKDKRAELLDNMDYVEDILKRGAEQSREKAERKLLDVKEAIGLI